MTAAAAAAAALESMSMNGYVWELGRGNCTSDGMLPNFALLQRSRKHLQG
jgi:hypothetical protein